MFPNQVPQPKAESSRFQGFASPTRGFTSLAVYNIGVNQTITATASLERQCTPAGVMVSSESPRPPFHGFCRNHWALSVSVRFTPTQQATA